MHGLPHPPIRLEQLSLSFPHKTCWEGFSAVVQPGDRVAVIGRNGSGKSCLLRMLAGSLEPTGGRVRIPEGCVIGHVPQVIESHGALSGGERLQAALTEALALHPDLLLLDEPTNHLDADNRRSLLRMLQGFRGTLLCVSHDPELLRECVDTLWRIDEGRIHVFHGRYDDLLETMRRERSSIEKELALIDRRKKDLHRSLMREQERAAKSKTKGKKSVEEGKWSRIAVNAKRAQGEGTTQRKRAALGGKKDALLERLTELRLPEVLVPKFSLPADAGGRSRVLSVRDGSVGFPGRPPLLEDITLSLGAGERVALGGGNGSGKSTLLRALRGDPRVERTGEWLPPPADQVGYLDQHYAGLDPSKGAAEILGAAVPHWPYAERRRHLNDFLFRKNEEVETPAAHLSGGEKARLSLALIAARTPRLLLLDEVTNNLDLETREHVIEVLRDYPGALLVVSHDGDFLERIGTTHRFEVIDRRLRVISG